MIACHSIKSVDQVRFNGKAIPLGPGGTGAQSTEWTYTPSSNQGSTNISSISRTGGLVTLVLSGSLPNQNGSQLQIINVNDRSFNGTFTVTQPNPADASTFTYLCGGADTTSSGGYVRTTLPDWKNRVHVDRTSCLGTHTSTFPELLSTSSLWTTAHRNLGRASVYIAHYYDATVYANGLPTISFVVSGKNDIFDPRDGSHKYTTNAALVIADYLTNKDFGFGLNYGTDIPLDPLIAAANLCDEQIPLAAGGTEPRYTINMTFDLAQTRGAVLQDMLNACAGRLTITSGLYNGQPGVWIGPSLSLDQSHVIGSIDFKPYLTTRDANNGVKGSYVSPANNWESGDFPPYCEDSNHGYVADKWLSADNGVRVWKDVSLHATTSSATAQRLAKIELERTRREGRLTLHCNMTAWIAVAGDVIEFTYPRYGWVSKTFEVLSSKLIVQADTNGGAPMLGVDLELAETDSTVYDWSSSEELAQSDTPSPAINNGQSVTGPMTLVLESGAPTSYVGADGIALPRILASWVASPDASVQSGGYVRVEYQRVGDTLWTPAGDVSGTQTQIYIDHVVSGWQYNVQVQAFRGGAGGGVGSGWAQAGPITVSATQTALVASNVKYPDGTPVSALQPAQAGADMTAAQALSYVGASESIIPNGNFILGNLDGWFVCEGSGTFSYAPIGGGASALRIAGSQQVAVGSPTCSVIPGAKYRVVYTAFANPGTQSIYFRCNYAATNLPQIRDSNRLGYTDFEAAWSGLAGGLNQYAFDWVCPSGVYFASFAIYAWNHATADIYTLSVTCVPYAAVGQYGADVTALQPSSYTGSSESIVPNGSFILGNVDGWFPCQGSGAFSYAPFGNGQSGLMIGGGGTIGVGSPTFSVEPGKKYRFVYTCFAGPGTQSVYLRINFQATYSNQIMASGGSTDFIAAGSINSGTLTPYTYDWVCPAGIYFASASIYQWNNATANLYLLSVTCVPFSGVAQWGADQTSQNTAAGIANQGALATLNQTNTVNIVAHAVNTQITYSSTVLVNIPANTTTTIASSTITTGGGYVKVRAMMEIFATSGTTCPYPQIIIHKGDSTGQQIAFYGNVYVVPSNTFGGTVVAIEAVDTSPSLSQQYTVTAYASGIAMQCDSISFVVENAKV